MKKQNLLKLFSSNQNFTPFCFSNYFYLTNLQRDTNSLTAAKRVWYIHFGCTTPFFYYGIMKKILKNKTKRPSQVSI